MVLVVNALVHERRHEQRNADDQVPDETETGHRVRLDVGQLVDEAARAIERQQGKESSGQRDGGGTGEYRREQGRISQQRGPDQVRPVDRRPGRVEVARQVGRGLEHRLVVGTRRRPLLLSSAGRIALEDCRICHKSLPVLAEWQEIVARTWRFNRSRWRFLPGRASQRQ